MTVEIGGSNWQIDHCLLIASFNLSEKSFMKKCFNWINLTPKYSTENNFKKAIIIHYLYLIPEIREKCFSRIFLEGFN